MGKRSDFERKERDFYPTPKEAVLPLVNHLFTRTKFIEPCAGNGALVDHLETNGLTCVYASDIEPQRSDIIEEDAFDFKLEGLEADYIITNPPWQRDILHRMIDHFRMIKPTWLLFDADWMHTKQSSELMKYCLMIISVGRVKWIPDSKMTGKDNCCWYLFDDEEVDYTEFVGR